MSTMKKLIALVLLLLCVLGVVGCMSKTYELPHDQFCYSVDGAQAYELDSADKQYLIDLLNSASDFVIYTQKQEVRYHSECGTFTDYTNKKSTTVSEEQRATINAVLGIN